MGDGRHHPVFDHQRHRLDKGQPLKPLKAVHAGLDPLLGKLGFQRGVKAGGQAGWRLAAGQLLRHPDAVEKVAGRLAGVVVAQVDRQADGHRAAALQQGQLGIDGQHQPGAQPAGQGDALGAGGGQHRLYRHVRLKKLGLVVRQAGTAQAAGPAGHGVPLGGGAVKLAVAVLRQGRGGGHRFRHQVGQSVRVLQFQVLADQGFQKQQPAVAVAEGVEHLHIDARAVVADPVQQLVLQVGAVDWRAGGQCLRQGGGQLAGGFHIMPEQPPVQRDLKIGELPGGQAQGLGQAAGVDVGVQRAADAEHPRVPPVVGGNKQLGDVIHLIPGPGHDVSPFFGSDGCVPVSAAVTAGGRPATCAAGQGPSATAFAAGDGRACSR